METFCQSPGFPWFPPLVSLVSSPGFDHLYSLVDELEIRAEDLASLVSDR
jgi:hypothetical protein